MHAEIKRPEEAFEYATPEHCHILEVASDAGDEMVSIARARVEPGITTAWHELDGISERYIILSGQGPVELGETETTEVGPGDVVRIPAGCRQRITIVGRSDRVFYAVCAPRFRAQAYINLEAQENR